MFLTLDIFSRILLEFKQPKTLEYSSKEETVEHVTTARNLLVTCSEFVKSLFESYYEVVGSCYKECGIIKFFGAGLEYYVIRKIENVSYLHALYVTRKKSIHAPYLCHAYCISTEVIENTIKNLLNEALEDPIDLDTVLELSRFLSADACLLLISNKLAKFNLELLRLFLFLCEEYQATQEEFDNMMTKVASFPILLILYEKLKNILSSDAIFSLKLKVDRDMIVNSLTKELKGLREGDFLIEIYRKLEKDFHHRLGLF